MRREKMIAGVLTNLLYMFLGVIGFFLSIFSYLEISYESRLFWLGLIALTVWFTLTMDRHICKYRRGVFLFSVAAYGIVCFRNRQEILWGFTSILQGIVEQMNTAYRTNLIVYVEGNPTPHHTTEALLALVFLVVLLYSLGIVRRFNRRMIGILCLAPVILALLLNTVPEVFPVGLLVLCFVGIAAGFVENQKNTIYLQQRSALSMLLLSGIVVAMAAGLLRLENRYQENLNEMNLNFRQYVQEEIWNQVTGVGELFFRGNSQSVLNGRLDRDDGFSYTGARALEVTVDDRPLNTLYLKGFVGGTYTGQQWEAIEESNVYNYASRQPQWNWQEVNFADILSIPYHAGEIGGFMEHHTMEIQRYTASGEYSYYPYFSDVRNESTAHGEGMLAGNSQRSWGFDYYQGTSYRPENYLTNYLAGSPWEELEAQYSQYVYDTYLDFPEEQLSRLYELARADSSQDVVEVTDFVKNTLAEGATYNLNVSAIPEDQDFAETFFFENSKEGYCIHFATTAVLLFRMKGIPARYVAGYMANANTFGENEEGSYTAMVKDDRAHAWAEIYVRGFGWIPVETTPGYVDLSPSVVPTETPVENTVTPTISPESTPTPTATPEEENQEESTSETKSNHLVLYIIGVLLLIAAGIFAWRNGRILYRRKLFERAPKKALLSIYEATYDALKTGGLSTEIEPFTEEFIQNASGLCDEVKKEEWEAFLATIMKAAYSDQLSTRAEVAEARRIYRRVCINLYDGLSWWGKIKFKIWKAYI